MRRFDAWVSACLAASALACGGSKDRGAVERCAGSGCPANGGATTGPGTGGARSFSSGGAAASGSPTGASGATSRMDVSNDVTMRGAAGGTTGSGGTTSSGGAAGGTTSSGGAAGGKQGSGGNPPSTGGGGGCVLPDAGTAEPWNPASHLDTRGALTPPAPAEGFQLVSPIVDLDPGQESYRCSHVVAPVSSEFDVGEWESQLPLGGVEFTLYRAESDTAAEGTLDGTPCTVGSGADTWLYTAAAARAHLAFPQGVGMALSAHERLLLDMHFINTGTDAVHPEIVLNATRARTDCGFLKAQAQVSFNTKIAIPVNGTQTVTGICHPAAGAKYFYMTTLTRRRGTDANIVHVLKDGKPGETLLDSTSWVAPQIRTWEAPDFLTFAPGESYAYNCSYRNDGNDVVTVGNSAETNELCMTFAYFFPANANPPTCN
jgi:hypothetical protein